MKPPGDQRRIAAALRKGADVHRRHAKQLEWQELNMYLTREQAAVGKPGRGCGLPVIDKPGSWPPAMQSLEQEQLDREAADLEFTKGVLQTPRCV